MTSPRFSFYIIPFKHEPLAESLERLARLGYHAFELPGDPDIYDPTEVKRLAERFGLAVSAVCGRMYGPSRDLCTADAGDRARAVAYFRTIVDLAAAVGAPGIIVGPTAVRRTMPEASPEQEWEWAVEGVAAIADAARGTGVTVILEPWNRYETYLLNRIEQADRLRRDTGRDNVGVMGDLFHMNLEESNIAGAIRGAGRHLRNIHFADSNRQAPGRGHIDFGPVMAALQEIGYRDHLSVEFLPPRAVFEHVVPRDFYDAFPAETIGVMKHAWAEATGERI